MTHEPDPITDNHLIDELLLDADQSTAPNARIHRARYRLRWAALHAGQTIRDIATEAPAPGESWHIISDGKFNFATWLPQIVSWFSHVDELDIVTWTTSRHAAEELLSLHQSGKIHRLNVYVSTFFRSRDPGTYTYLRTNLVPPNATFHAFHNHAKLLLASSQPTTTFLVIETSANLNSNPRYEQYTITNDQALHDFHKTWLAQIRSAKPPPSRAATKPKSNRPWLGYSVRRAGLNVSAYSQAKPDREFLLRLKANPQHSPQQIDNLATRLAALVRANLSPIPPNTILTHPPQGASWPNPHLATLLARRTAELLDHQCISLLDRTDTKRGHHHMRALQQSPFLATRIPDPRPTLAIVIDDAIISGTTMRLSLQALLTAQIPAYGFAYYAD